MDIQPTQPGVTPSSLGLNRLQKGQAVSPVQSEESKAAKSLDASIDSVQISDEARKLQDRVLQDRAERQRDLVDQLPPGRLREMLQRIMDGYYDRTDVRRKVIEKIAEELQHTKDSDPSTADARDAAAKAAAAADDAADTKAPDAKTADAEAAQAEDAGTMWMTPKADDTETRDTPAS